MRRLLALGVAAAVLVVLAPRAAAAEEEVDRVLVVSVPTLSWDDLDRAETPNLDRIFAESAIADLSTRAVVRQTTAGDGYTTMGAGTRARGEPDVDGLAFEVGENYLGDPAADVFLRGTGLQVRDGLFSIGLPQIDERNENLDFDAEVGALGDALAAEGIPRAVIANADGSEQELDVEYGRTAVSALMTGEGTVPGGRISRELLIEEARAPFGVRLDENAVAEAFSRAWAEGGVVMVEASDLVRADAYRERATSEQRERQFVEALERTDAMVGRMLEQVDPERDAVLVVGPYHAEAEAHLTVAALRAPGVEPGLVRSATTRRTGFVKLEDLAPTILDLVGVPRDSSMEGRAFERSAGGGSYEDRLDFLVEADEAARFRDTQLTPIAVTFVVAQGVLWITAVWSLWKGSERSRRRIERAALAVLAVLPATYLIGVLPVHEWGALALWAILIGAATVIGVAADRLFRRDPVDPLLAVLVLMQGVILLDVVAGGRLQFNTLFGYTPTVAGRFAGIGNLAFAQVSAGAVLLAVLVAYRVGGRRGIWAGIGVLLATLIIDGSPFWGSDVGGVLTMVPVVGITALMLLGWRVRRGWILVIGAVSVVLVVLAGFLDLARPEESRTHLGRMFEDIGDNGFEAFETVVVRKVGANVAVLGSSEWTLMLPVVFGFILYLVWRAPWRLERIHQLLPAERAARAGFIVAAALGFALNDSGIAIPGLMLGVMNASLVYLVMKTRHFAPVDA